MAAFILWSAWLAASLAMERSRIGQEAAVVAKLKGLERALMDMREASVSISDTASPEAALSRWRRLYLAYRDRVYQLDGRDPTVQRVVDSLIEVYAYVTRTEKIRQSLLRGGQTSSEAAALESEFRSDVNLALTAVREAEFRLRYPSERVPAAQRATIYGTLFGASLLAGLGGVLLIVTERRLGEQGRTREMLENAVARAHSVEETVREGILSLDDKGLIRSANPAVEQMFGYEPEELEGRNLRELVPGAFTVPQIGAARELKGCRKDGAEFPIEFAMKRVPVGDASLLLAFLRDVSHRMAAGKPLAEAERLDLAAALAARFAHNFNNALTPISGYADLLTYSVEENDPLRNDIEEIKKAGERAASLTAQMLAFSGKQVLRPQPTSVNALVMRVACSLPPLLGKGIEVRSANDPGAGQVRVDPEQLEQVLLRLAVNAREAMPGGGTFSIQTAAIELDERTAGTLALTRGHYAVIEVRDTGCGMDEEVQKHLFEPFFTTKQDARGMGLGLASSWGVIRQSGGTIQVESAPGKGSAFRIYLPRERAAAQQGSAALSRPYLRDSLRR